MEKIAAGKEKPTGAAVIETDFRNPVLSRNVCRYIDENHSDFRITREAKPTVCKGSPRFLFELHFVEVRVIINVKNYSVGG